jgi:hypothetical protein
MYTHLGIDESNADKIFNYRVHKIFLSINPKA